MQLVTDPLKKGTYPDAQLRQVVESAQLVQYGNTINWGHFFSI